MRAPGEIRKQLLLIRDKNQLPYGLLCERSRCSYNEIVSALKLEASENTLRRLDAFLDAPALHVPPEKDTRLLWEIEQLSRELYHEFRVRTAHPLRVQRLSVDRQKRMLLALNFHAKCMFVQMMHAETGLKFRIPDGQSYWQFKAKCLRRTKAIRASNGNDARFSWPGAMVEVRHV